MSRYGSVTEAAIALVSEGRGNFRGDVGVTMGNICCNLKRKTSMAYGSVWWYEGDEDAPKPDAK